MNLKWFVLMVPVLLVPGSEPERKESPAGAAPAAVKQGTRKASPGWFHFRGGAAQRGVAQGSLPKSPELLWTGAAIWRDWVR